jgi:predicted RNA-binding Zn-ribbon protein involved in translation (DUF1610 family)
VVRETQCPNCGAEITRPDPQAQTPGASQTETAECPDCGKWLWRRPGGRWQETG